MHIYARFLASISLVSLFTQNSLYLINSFLPTSAKANEVIRETKPEEKDHLLQFVSNGSVVGFNKKGVVIALNQSALNLAFVNPNEVAPVADTIKRSSNKSSELSVVTYKNLWDGVDVKYEQDPNSIVKSTYIVEANGNETSVDLIKINYNRPIKTDLQGNLKIGYDFGTITESAPIAWQLIKNKKRPVSVSYSTNGTIVGFQLGAFIPNIPIIIDPSIVWSSFYGGSSDESPLAITTDSSNNIFISGYSTGTWGSPVRLYTASNDCFIAKVGSTGNLVWSTFLGGSGTDFCRTLEVNVSGNIYVTGYSSATWGSPINDHISGTDGFIAKLDGNGTLLWNTFFGAAGTDTSSGLKLDDNSNVYVSGNSAATWGSPVRAYTLGGDGFVAKFDSDGGLLWNTFLGGTGTDQAGTGILIFDEGYVYSAGYSDATWGSPVRDYLSGYDSFLAKLDGNTGGIVWTTFVGGLGTDQANRSAIDSNNNIYLAGSSNATWGSPIRPYTSSTDIFVAKIDTNGNLLWNTFLGGSGGEASSVIAVDNLNNAYITAQTNATWGEPLRAYSTGTDDFAAKLDTNGNLLWNTFLGGSGTDQLAVPYLDGTNLLVAGTSNATWGSPLNAYTAGSDIFLAKLDITPTFSSISSTTTSTTAAINWSTDILSSSWVDYGLTYLYGNSTSEIDSSSRVTSHSVGLSNLSSCATYHYRVRSKDVGLTEGIGGDNTFETSGCGQPIRCSDEPPGVIAPKLYGAVRVSSTSVFLSFTEASMPVSNYMLEYGTKSGTYQYAVSNLGVNSRSQMTYLVKALSPGTTYYFRVRAQNGCATGPWSNELASQAVISSGQNISEKDTSLEIEQKEAFVDKTVEESLTNKDTDNPAPKGTSLFLKTRSSQIIWAFIAVILLVVLFGHRNKKKR